MSYFRLPLYLAILFFSACQQNNPELQEQLVLIQSQLDAANIELNNLKAKPKNFLVHTVLFQLKPKLNTTERDSLISGLKSLSKISYTHNLLVGTPAKTGDTRLRTDYDLILQMNFSSLEDLAKYQNHEQHLKLKTDIGRFLAAKPFVYDYWRK